MARKDKTQIRIEERLEELKSELKLSIAVRDEAEANLKELTNKIREYEELLNSVRGDKKEVDTNENT